MRVRWGDQTVDATLTYTDINNGSVTVTVPNATLVAQGGGNVNVSSQIIDQAGNAGAVSPETLVAVDNAPMATITLADSALAAGESTLVTITFTEAVMNFNSDDDVTVDNGNLSLMTSADGGITWTGTFTPTAWVESTANLISLADTYTDMVGNQGTAAVSANYVIDITPPTLQMVTGLLTTVQLEALGVNNGGDFSPQITAVGNAGEYVVTWYGDDTIGNYRVFVQKFNADGTTTGNGIVKLEASDRIISGDDHFSQIAAVGNAGEYVVTWYAIDSFNEYSIYVQKFNADGTTTGNATLKLEAAGVTDGNDWYPQVTGVGSVGEYVVTWYGIDSNGDTSIFVQKFNADGTTTGNAMVQLEAIGVTNGIDQDPQVSSIGSSGEYVVTWYGIDSNGDNSIFVQKFNADGTTTGNAMVQLEAIGVANEDDLNPQISAIGTNGEYAITWQGRDASGDFSIFVQKFNADGTATTVQNSDIGISGAAGIQNNILDAGDTVSITVTFVENVVVTGSPQLALNIGGSTVYANYASGSGSAQLAFTYTIQAGENDANGISIDANALHLNGGSIRDVAGNDAVITSTAIADNAGYLVDTVAPLAFASAPMVAEFVSGSIINATEASDGTDVLVDLTGTNAMAGDTVRIYWGGQVVDTVLSATDISNNSVNVMVLRSTLFNQGDGNFDVSGRIIDLAGNVSALSASVSVLLSTTFSPGFVINGEGAGDYSGHSVSTAGDVNGDGVADLIVGAFGAGTDGRSYVVWGKPDGAGINLSDVANGIGGFAIDGANYTSSGLAVSAAGDVNGDGFADLIVADYSGFNAAWEQVGRSFVVWGKADGTAINIVSVIAGTSGFVISGELRGDESGYSVSSAGDVNGDGLSDLIVGARYNDAGGNQAGRSYVIFGKLDGTMVNLTDVAAGLGGFAVTGETALDYSGYSVAAAGDVNGDGLSDVIVGAYGHSNNVSSGAGRSYVVWGKADGSEINLGDVALGNGGFVIKNSAAGMASGWSVSSAGDVNGDGLADLIISHPYAYTAEFEQAGRSYVVWGKQDGNAIDLANVIVGNGGFSILGEVNADLSGYSVSAAGDVNGDGFADLIVGAILSSAGDTYAGRSYVVFGKADGSAVSLATVAAGTGGFAITGQAFDERSGVSVSTAGDVNGDGLADLIVGAYYNDAAGANAGRSYVVFGKTDTAEVKLGDVVAGGVAAHSISYNGTTGANSWAGTATSEIALGGQGDDTLTGNGGADVLYGGEGNDTLIINADNIAKLSLGVTVGLLSRMDGGGDIDTLKLDGNGLVFDLTTIANTAVGNPETGSRISSIEKIDITGTGNNTLNIGVADVLDMSGMNLFNSGNGWSGLAASVNKHQVVVDGDSGDALNMSGGWTDTGTTATYGSNTYQIYNATASAAQLLVDTDVARAIL